ncbi:XRE family transcriptional regulator [Akkermansia muciniphila]|uniref:XRE family transcriptional regulator n=1 Tax=Akkermansia muciniphila TaxID=239935 RepID=UPI00122F059D|nr:XRE family transcriptional regulator [Akkermansia muciniphila]KAA3386305.1 XRE family transcriptional regulator [Akkermansia muciniphila]KAA3405065.1 XRE family transcriptional regulator [Akkermansia muciniphila]
MNNMYSLIEDLCKKRGTNITQMCRDVEIPRSVFSELKAGRTKQLSNKYLPIVANYFGVSVDYLIGNKEKSAAKSSDGLSEKENRDIAKKVENLMQELTSSGDLMFDGDPMTEEAQESLRNALTLGYELARQKNKEKYTPKKYRK